MSTDCEVFDFLKSFLGSTGLEMELFFEYLWPNLYNSIEFYNDLWSTGLILKTFLSFFIWSMTFASLVNNSQKKNVKKSIFFEILNLKLHFGKRTTQPTMLEHELQTINNISIVFIWNETAQFWTRINQKEFGPKMSSLSCFKIWIVSSLFLGSNFNFFDFSIFFSLDQLRKVF